MLDRGLPNADLVVVVKHMEIDVRKPNERRSIDEKHVSGNDPDNEVSADPLRPEDWHAGRDDGCAAAFDPGIP